MKKDFIVEVFYHIDEHCKSVENHLSKVSIESLTGSRGPERRMTSGEMLTIMCLWGYSGFKTFKEYYVNFVEEYLKSEFPELVAYNRFIELMPTLEPFAKALVVHNTHTTKNNLKTLLFGIYYIDSFSIKASHNKRILSHKTFRNMAQRGKTSMGWFYGFKLHIIINASGEIAALCVTAGNIADNNENVLKLLLKNIRGKVFGDKGYLVNAKLREYLLNQGIELITKIRSNMKNILMNFIDKLLLRRRGVIESVGNILKSKFSLEHTRHRSIGNFGIHLLVVLIGYDFKDKKPTLRWPKKVGLLPA